MSEPAPELDAPATLASGDGLAPGLVVQRHMHRSKDADVYRVWSDTHRAHLVAKVLRPDRTREGPARRLALEARTLAELSHPAIVRAIDSDLERPLLVLEELQGRSVRAELAASGDATWLRICDIGLQLSAALHYLHGRDLIHADVKPANAIACTDGRVMLIDFSLVRAPGEVGTGVGTRQFVSPEQARGGHIASPTDVWGLGIILFRAATGTLPFLGEGYPQMEQPAPRVRERRAVPRRLAAAIDSCLSPEPGERPSAGSLHDQLRAARDRIEQRLTRPLD